MLTTLLNPDKGGATIEGLDISKDYRKIRPLLGYMPGRFSLYPDLTVEENLSFFASIFGVRVKDSYDLIAPIYQQIEPFRKRQASKLSGGMKQKLSLSCALIHHPSVLFLDEPTTGIDAVSRSELWDMLKNLKEKGITILVSTPYMDEASLCERIALFNEGRILGIDTPKGIIKQFKSRLFAISADNMYSLLEATRKVEGVMECYPFGQMHHLIADSKFDPHRFTEQLGSLTNLTIEPAKPTIEDVFINLMKQ